MRTMFLAAALVGAVSAVPVQAQSGAAGAGATASPPAAGEPAAPAAPNEPRAFDRWIDVQAANVLLRYRYIDTSAGLVSARQLQDSGALKARLKFDRGGRFSLTAGVATGNGFISGWNNTGIGTGDAMRGWYLKQLFVAGVPGKGVELSAGGLSFVRGESTEITTYDNDGYLVGERVSVRRPRELLVDELTVTVGFLGDVARSNLLPRLHRLADVNYAQILASKKATPWLTASADYTHLSGVSTVRAAAAARTPHAGIIDSIRYEQYARLGDTSAFGFAAYAEKTPFARLTVGGGYADIDLDYGGLNGDRYNKGRRVYGLGTLRLTAELSAGVFAGRAVHNSVPLTNKTRVEAILAWNALTTLKRASLLP